MTLDGYILHSVYGSSWYVIARQNWSSSMLGLWILIRKQVGGFTAQHHFKFFTWWRNRRGFKSGTTLEAGRRVILRQKAQETSYWGVATLCQKSVSLYNALYPDCKDHYTALYRWLTKVGKKPLGPVHTSEVIVSDVHSETVLINQSQCIKLFIFFFLQNFIEMSCFLCTKY